MYINQIKNAPATISNEVISGSGIVGTVPASTG
jgi:hypothetical protein